MSTLRAEAAKYLPLGWQLLPVAGKVPLIAWKDAPPPDQLDHLWDDPRATGIAVVLGQPSGGLIVRDFDDVHSYLEWCDDQSELATELPTARTPRPGRHVFARCETLFRTTKLRDGELRGDGGIVVLPPSIHPNGKRYDWMRDPFRQIPIVEPNVLVGAAQQSRQTGRTPQREEPVNTCTKYMACVNSDELLFIDCAIEQTCPTGPGQRNRRIFDFARYLRTAYDKATDPDALRCHVEDRHRAALPYIRTKDFDETWRDFLHAWGRVEKPAGGTLAAVERTAMEDPFTLELSDMNLDKVARLLRAAARIRGEDGVFFMDFRTMGKSVDLSAVAARKIALRLEAMGHLAVVEHGTAGRRGKATGWRWLGP
jgi:hypothetical protein